MSRILISGYYGYGNAGDEAILMSMVSGLRSAFPSVEITAVSQNPLITQKDHGIRAVSRFNAPGLFLSLATSDVLLMGGGSLLQDVTSVRSLMYYLGLMALARLMGKKVMLFANGYGPVSTRQGRLLTKSVLNSIQVATFRDKPSYQEVSDLGVSRPLMEVTADPVFLLEDLVSARDAEHHRFLAREAMAASGVPEVGGPLIAVCLRPWKHSSPDFDRAVKSALVRLAASGSRVLLVPFHYDHDLSFSEAFTKDVHFPIYLLRQKLRPQSLIELIGLMDLVLGMRLHSLIFAVSKCVPCGAISYDPKVTSFIETVGLPVASRAADPDTDLIYRTADDLLRQRENVSGALRAKRADLTKLAYRNIEVLGTLLGDEAPPWVKPSYH